MIRLIIIERPDKNIQIWPDPAYVTMKFWLITSKQLNELHFQSLSTVKPCHPQTTA